VVWLALAAISGWKRLIRMASRRVRPQRANANSEVPRETGVVYGDHILGKSTSPRSSSLGSWPITNSEPLSPPQSTLRVLSRSYFSCRVMKELARSAQRLSRLLGLYVSSA
jgi:hypothetical protein